MADSLTIGGQVELLGLVASTIPACSGAIFSLAPGHSLSSAVNTSTVQAALALDGERPVGRRASNRTPVLPIVIHVPEVTATGATARALLAGAREVLARLVDQPDFQLIWTRDGGLPMVLDCYQASQFDRDHSILRDKALVSSLTITCTAQPFGRSDVPVVTDFPLPIAGQTAPASPVTIDNYSSVPVAGWTQSTLGPGGNSAFFTVAPAVRGTATYARTGLAPLNLTGEAGLTVWAGFGSSSFYPFFGLRRGGPVTFTFTLTDGTHTARRHITRRVYLSNNSVGPIWQKIRLPIPSGSSINLAAVTGYTITVSNERAGSLAYSDVYLSQLTAVPVPTAGAVTPTAGTVWDLAGLEGSARAGISLQVQQPAGVLQQVTKVLTTVGPVAMLVPADCTVIQAGGALGPGGKGSRSTSSGAYAGAPGGEGSWEFGLRVTPGDLITGNIAHGGQSNSGAAGDTTLTIGGVTITGHGASNRADGVTGALAGTGTATYTPIEKLTGQAGGFEGGIGNWTGVTNAGVAPTAVNPRSGAGALRVTSVAGGDMIAGGCTTASILTSGWGSWGLSAVVVKGFCRAVTTGRSFQVGAEFYDVNGVSLGQLFGGSATSVTTGYTAAATANLTAPGGSRWARPLVKVLATGGAAEGHTFDDLSLVTGQSWAGGSGAAQSGGAAGGGGGVGGNTGVGSNGTAPNGGAAGSGSPSSGKGGKGQGSSSFGTGGKGGTPGGGGAGANAGLLAQVLDGGFGGDGGLSLAFQQRAAFKYLVIHRPGFDAPDTFTPFVTIPPTDTPDGLTEYAIPSLVPGSNARFGSPATPSTFTIYAVSAGWHNPGAARNVTVQMNQYEQNGGSVYVSPISRNVTPNNLTPAGLSPLVRLGELTLPGTAMPDDNVNAYFTATIDSDDALDQFQEIIFLDTQGTSVVVQSPVAYSTYWVDEPVGGQLLGNVMASQFDRNDAVSMLAYADCSGPPLNIDPLGNQTLFVYVADAGALAPSLRMLHFPRWLQDRLA